MDEIFAIIDAVGEWNYANTYENCSGVTVQEIEISDTAPTAEGTWWIYPARDDRGTGR